MRRPRTQKVVSNSRLAGAYTELAVEGISDNNTKQAIDIDNRYRFVWNVDIEQHFGRIKAFVGCERIRDGSIPWWKSRVLKHHMLRVFGMFDRQQIITCSKILALKT